MSKQESVLVVDEITDTADVLRAVLESRGVSVNRVRRLEEPVDGNPAQQPSVMVLDVESLRGGPTAPADHWRTVPQVIIGSVQTTASQTENADDTAQRLFLRKPFQFAELVQAIESLIARA